MCSVGTGDAGIELEQSVQKAIAAHATKIKRGDVCMHIHVYTRMTKSLQKPQEGAHSHSPQLVIYMYIAHAIEEHCMCSELTTDLRHVEMSIQCHNKLTGKYRGI